MDIKAIVFDLDRTLLTSDEIITDRTVEILKQARRSGVELVICTGRSQTSAGYAIERLEEVSYIISHAGCVITDCRTGQEVYRRSLPRSLAAEISAYADQFDEDVFVEAMSSATSIVSEGDIVRAETLRFSEKYIDLIKRNIIIPQNLTDFIRYNDIVEIDKFFMYARTAELSDHLYEEYSKWEGCTTLIPLPRGVELIPNGVDKGVALRELAKIIGIGLENMMVAGDSDNDKHMFLPEVFKVAVDNAIPSLKELADHIAPSNDNDGVAEAVRKFVLKEDV